MASGCYKQTGEQLVQRKPVSRQWRAACAQGTEVALQLHHSPHPVLYPGPSDRSNMHAQELLRDPTAMQQALVTFWAPSIPTHMVLDTAGE